ncbi:hypothetical protein ACHAXT_005801 [Thalassiosira profunda]
MNDEPPAPKPPDDDDDEPPATKPPAEVAPQRTFSARSNQAAATAAALKDGHVVHAPPRVETVESDGRETDDDPSSDYQPSPDAPKTPPPDPIGSPTTFHRPTPGVKVKVKDPYSQKKPRQPITPDQRKKDSAQRAQYRRERAQADHARDEENRRYEQGSREVTNLERWRRQRLTDEEGQLTIEQCHDFAVRPSSSNAPTRVTSGSGGSGDGGDDSDDEDSDNVDSNDEGPFDLDETVARSGFSSDEGGADENPFEGPTFMGHPIKTAPGMKEPPGCPLPPLSTREKAWHAGYSGEPYMGNEQLSLEDLAALKIPPMFREAIVHTNADTHACWFRHLEVPLGKVPLLDKALALSADKYPSLASFQVDEFVEWYNNLVPMLARFYVQLLPFEATLEQSMKDKTNEGQLCPHPEDFVLEALAFTIVDRCGALVEDVDLEQHGSFGTRNRISHVAFGDDEDDDVATPHIPVVNHIQGVRVNAAYTPGGRRGQSGRPPRRAREPNSGAASANWRQRRPRFDGQCAACGGFGHKAAQCDMFAMYCFIIKKT